jgi:putative cell wall-binding protein
MAMETICSLTNKGKILCQGFGGFGVIAAGYRIPAENFNLGNVPFPVEVTKTISVSRVQGTNRYKTAVEISKLAFPQESPTRVFIASGENFPDALSAGPVAAALGAPLLLTQRASLNTDVSVELARLNPGEVTILGGLSTVSQQVEDDLITNGWNVSRIAGGNRYETAVMTSKIAYESSDTVIIAAGENFPDALAGSSAASKLSAPLLLVQGHSLTLIPAVASYLSELRPEKIYVLGGPTVVSDAVVSALGEFGNVERIAGTHRVDTSVQIAKKFFESNQAGIVTFGWNFPDALAGSMLASRLGAPIYTSLQGCTHRVLVNDLRRSGVNTLYVLGSEATLSARVAELAPCD